MKEDNPQKEWKKIKTYCKLNCLILIIFSLVIGKDLNADPSSIRKLSLQELNKIGKLIYKNECNNKKKFLIVWHDNENFMSLGIGHFIWYPENEKVKFKESFPDFIEFAKKKGIKIPHFLNTLKPFKSPWKNRDYFISNAHSKTVEILRNFLSSTINIQTHFMVKRFDNAVLNILKTCTNEQKKHILIQLNRMTNSPFGFYPLIDYVNFKGEGILKTEQYNGIGWGLKQVLLNMKGKKTGITAVLEFADSAEKLLENRVRNSKTHKKNKKWLPLWKKRINTYRQINRKNM